MAPQPKITPEIRKKFIDLLADTGNVSKVCTALCISRNQIYIRKRKIKSFSDQWDAAMVTARAMLEDEAWRRAYDGVEKHIYYQGQQVLGKDGNPALIREYSDHLMTVLLNGNFPEKYRYNSKIDHNVSGEMSLTVKVIKFADAGNNDTK